MWEILCSAVTVASDCLVNLVGPHCGYVFFTDRKVRQLDGELKGLVGASEMMGHRVEKARDDMNQILTCVKEWMEDEQIVAEKAQNVLNYNESAQKACCYGWLPNPKVRYCLGKDASETVEQIRALIDRKNKWGSGEVHGYNDPPGRVHVAREGNSSAGGGRDSIQEHIGGSADLNSSAADEDDIFTRSQASIFRDIMEALGDDKLKVIGVYGPGGVGKTTLLKKVEEKLGKEGSPFNMIVTAEVSETPDLTKIRYDIAYSLRLSLKDEPSEKGKKDLLFKRLQKDPDEKVLVILDDLWGKLDLEAVGIPPVDKIRGCKLLLSSRYKEVLDQKMHADRTFRLKGLDHDEAVRLFEKTVCDELQKDEELKAKAAQVVTKLEGLPLYIISVARTLKCGDVYTWENALIKIEDPNVKNIVKLSYDHLEIGEAKSLFLLCGLIGGRIKVELLLGLGLALGLFEGFHKTIKSSRNRLSAMLGSLRSVYLLQDGGDDKENVTIHDLYSEEVVSTPFEGQNSLTIYSNYGSWPKEKLEKCWACLINVGSGRLAQLTRRGFPGVTILMFSEQHDLGNWDRQDFAYMEELRVLYVRSMHFASLPSSIEILVNLQSLYLDCCTVEDVAILGKLKALQILSFAGSKISRLPKEIGELRELRLLNLSNCNKLKIIEPGVLKGLANLEELYMKGSFDRWMGKDEIPSESCNAKLAELKSLTKLSALEILIPNPSVLLEASDLPFGNLTRFWINIGNVKGREFECLRTLKLKLEGCQSILSKEWVQKTLSKAESLFLENLINLEKIRNGPVAPDCFSKLKVVRIVRCHRLKNLWFLSEMQRLVHLEEILVSECDSLQAIITDDGGKVEVAADDRVVLPNVRHLDLSYLTNMLSFCTGAEGAPIQVSFPRLESLVMVGLLDLEKIFLKSDWILNLPNLVSLKIDNCRSTKVVFDLEELKVAGDVEILPQLTNLTLSKLPDLQHVWKHDVKLQGLSAFRNLKELEVEDTGLAFIFPISVAKCLREIRKIEVADCQNMEAVIVDEEGRDEGTDDIIEFLNLERLWISNCPMKKFFSCPSGKRELVTTTSDSQDTYSDSFFDRKVSLPSLEELWFDSVGSLKRIWHGELPRFSFCKLATLTLHNCSELLDVFPSTIIGGLPNLKEVQVSKCPSLESLFDCGPPHSNTERTIIYGGDDTATKSSKLESLVLRDLKNLRHIWQSNGHSDDPFPSLRFIEVKSCPCLRMLFPTFTPEFLGQIIELVVESCEDMELIADHEEYEEAIGSVIIFSELTALRLFELPKFKSFLPEKYSLEFPSLQVSSRVSCGTKPDQDLGDWESYERQPCTWRDMYLKEYRTWRDCDYFSEENPNGCTIC